MLIMFELDLTVHLGKTDQAHGPVLTLILAIPLMLACHLNWVFRPLNAEDVFKRGNWRSGDAFAPTSDKFSQLALDSELPGLNNSLLSLQI